MPQTIQSLLLLLSCVSIASSQCPSPQRTARCLVSAFLRPGDEDVYASVATVSSSLLAYNLFSPPATADGTPATSLACDTDEVFYGKYRVRRGPLSKSQPYLLYPLSGLPGQ